MHYDHPFQWAYVTVTRIQYEFWTSNRIGQDSPGPGFFWIGNGSTQYSPYAQPNGTTSPIPWTADVTNRDSVLSRTTTRVSVSGHGRDSRRPGSRNICG